MNCGGDSGSLFQKTWKPLPLIVSFSPQSFILHASHKVVIWFLFLLKLFLTLKSQVYLLILSILNKYIQKFWDKVYGTLGRKHLGSSLSLLLGEGGKVVPEMYLHISGSLWFTNLGGKFKKFKKIVIIHLESVILSISFEKGVYTVLILYDTLGKGGLNVLPLKFRDFNFVE